jgi:hypothetical protein
MILKPLHRQLKPLTGRPGSTCSASNGYLLCTMQHKSVTVTGHDVQYKNVIIRNIHYIQFNIWKGKHSSQNQTAKNKVYYTSIKTVCILQYQISVQVFTLLTLHIQFSNFKNSYCERINVKLETNMAFT